MRNCMEMLRQRWAQGFFVCVGLDPDPDKIPDHCHAQAGGNVSKLLTDFCAAIINATQAKAAAFKPNRAFFDGHGEDGIRALRIICDFAHAVAPEVPVILDGKWGDIDNTNKGYVQYAHNIMKADGVTLHPYMGRQSLRPFLDQPDKGCFILCRTSNQGADEFQSYPSTDNHFTPCLYELIADRVDKHWNPLGNCGLVVGATAPRELLRVRCLAPTLPILIPGVGAQGGSLEQAVSNGRDDDNTGFIVNVSRSVLYASAGTDFAQAAAAEVERLTEEIERYRLA